MTITGPALTLNWKQVDPASLPERFRNTHGAVRAFDPRWITHAVYNVSAAQFSRAAAQAVQGTPYEDRLRLETDLDLVYHEMRHGDVLLWFESMEARQLLLFRPPGTVVRTVTFL